ncbi:MAG: 50S ribosomal protein L13 [bacterium]|nr:50S ribosomal protein L13 [bacterium]
MQHIIDATNKKLGRVASEAAVVLMGKNNPSFRRNKLSYNSVLIKNVSKAHILEKKKKETSYAKYSGYPGGLRYETMKNLIAQKGYSSVFERAIKGMIPSNRLRGEMMKRLKIEE